MSIVLVGGMDRLGEQYRKEAVRAGMELYIFSQNDQKIEGRIKCADAVVIFTNKISHHARDKAKKAASRHGVPIFMHHSCGVCTFRECLNCLNIMSNGTVAGKK